MHGNSVSLPRVLGSNYDLAFVVVKRDSPRPVHILYAIPIATPDPMGPIYSWVARPRSPFCPPNAPPLQPVPLTPPKMIHYRSSEWYIRRQYTFRSFPPILTISVADGIVSSVLYCCYLYPLLSPLVLETSSISADLPSNSGFWLWSVNRTLKF